ncbi:MAG TPA: cytochrome c biogenesis protein ResB [Verrucomicrobiae bacterium]|nr:cytochrome c biogenesis protein ResB [Verrucomicrobiae bacterium]
MSNILNFFTSLRLTVACLALALGLVFIGTLAQVKLGLYVVQDQFFNSYLIWWGPAGSNFKIPVYPGGYLIGGVLLINLIAAHIKRFELSRKKIGIFVIHAGLILLLVGQLVTQLFQVESFMTIEEGGSRNYSESGRMSELAVIDKTDPQTDLVVAIPQPILQHRKEVAAKSLPFKIKVDSFYDHSIPELAGSKLLFKQEALRTSMNARNIPAASVTIETDSGNFGPFTVSNWLSEDQLVSDIATSFESRFAPNLVAPPSFKYKGHEYQLFMRPIRYYKPFTMQLMHFAHDRYMGTEIAKNFSSRIKLLRPETGENREVLIYMNNPLRYWGETYYQGSFLPNDAGTVLQVVRNPSWLTPYIACALVGAGLVIQFMSHLIKFARKRSAGSAGFQPAVSPVSRQAAH